MKDAVAAMADVAVENNTTLYIVLMHGSDAHVWIVYATTFDRDAAFSLVADLKKRNDSVRAKVVEIACKEVPDIVKAFAQKEKS